MVLGFGDMTFIGHRSGVGGGGGPKLAISRFPNLAISLRRECN